MDLQLTGKRAVITGGSRGIGRATARILAEEGCDVAICARSEGPLKEVADEIAKATGRKIVPLSCDIMQPESIKRFFAGAAAALGGIDILVNGAARPGGSPGTIENVAPETVLMDYEEKAIAYIRCSQEAIPYMKQGGWGRIIHLSGGAGRAPSTGVGGGMRNAAVINLTKSMANALGQYGIGVNAILPGLTITEGIIERFTEQASQRDTTLEAVLSEQDTRLPTRHMNTSEDIGQMIAFLCSPLAVGVNGEAIGINSGASQDIHF